MAVIKTIEHPDGTHRVHIYCHDGSYGFGEEVWADDVECWCPLGGKGYSVCITDSAERAEAEARGRVRWLAELGKDDGKDIDA